MSEVATEPVETETEADSETEPETETALAFMPDDWKARPEHATYSLAKRLILAQIIVGTEDEVPNEDTVATWLAEALKEDERQAIAQYLAVVEWLDVDEDTHGAYLSQLTVPDALAPQADPWTRDPIETFGSERIVVDAAPAAELPPVAEAPVVVEADGQIVAVTEPEKPSTLKPMNFRSGEEVGAVRRALDNTVKEYEKLAKETEAIGEPGAAKILREKAALIKTQLLPQVTAQQNLPFNERETLPGIIARTIAGEARSRAKAALMKNLVVKKGESRDDAVARQQEKLDDLEALIGNLGEQVGALCVRFLTAASERGIIVGKQMLAADGPTVAREAMQLVEFELQQGRATA